MNNGKLFYEMRMQGLTNAQIGQRHGFKPHSVGARVSEYRKQNDLPQLPRSKANGFKKLLTEDEEIRKENMKRIKVRKNGIKDCPTMTCEGFGFDKKLDLER